MAGLREIHMISYNPGDGQAWFKRFCKQNTSCINKSKSPFKVPLYDVLSSRLLSWYLARADSNFQTIIIVYIRDGCP